MNRFGTLAMLLLLGGLWAPPLAQAEEVTTEITGVIHYESAIQISTRHLNLCVFGIEGAEALEDYLARARAGRLQVTFHYNRHQWGRRRGQWCGQVTRMVSSELGTFVISEGRGYLVQTSGQEPDAGPVTVSPLEPEPVSPPVPAAPPAPEPAPAIVLAKPAEPAPAPVPASADSLELASADRNRLSRPVVASVGPEKQGPEIPARVPAPKCRSWLPEGRAGSAGYEVGVAINAKDRKDLRERLRQEVFERYCVYLFGLALDRIEEKVAAEFDLRLAADRAAGLEPARGEGPVYVFTIAVPPNFVVAEMELRINVSRQDRRLTVYQDFGGEEVLLLDVSVALGQVGWTTPTGNFWLKRIVKNPYWYPPHWAKQTRPSQPGSNNPYGLWMSELSRDQSPGDHGFAVTRDTGIRVHSTNRPGSIGRYASHGCIRIHPQVANELFPALLHYLPHETGKSNGRGIVHPLFEPIPLVIVQK
ncbi:MAG: L,D-transpeptidase [Thermodesulfobacteriota bacterium]